MPFRTCKGAESHSVWISVTAQLADLDHMGNDGPRLAKNVGNLQARPPTEKLYERDVVSEWTQSA